MNNVHTLLCCLLVGALSGEIALAQPNRDDANREDTGAVAPPHPSASASVQVTGGHVTAGHGTAGAGLASGSTPAEAIARFRSGASMSAASPAWRAASSAWRTGNLVRLRALPLGQDAGRVVLSYRQEIGGLPVEGSMARVVVTSGPPSTVVLASGRLLEHEPAPASVLVSAASAESIARSLETTLDGWSKAQLVIFAPELFDLSGEPRRAWKISGFAGAVSRTLYLDQESGELLHSRSETHYFDLQGNVDALATPGPLPDVSYNPPLPLPLGSIRVQADGVETLTSSTGDFTLTGLTSNPTLIQIALEGPWCRVESVMGFPVFLEQSVPAGSFASLRLNPLPDELTTAQVNAFFHVNAAHDFYATRQPSFGGLDVPLLVRVNSDDTPCNAFFCPIPEPRLEFMVSTPDCSNTAFRSVIAHEYGHFVVHTHGLRQGPFGEGYADTFAALLYDDPQFGPDAFGPGTVGRDASTAEAFSPCIGSNHACGQVLARLWWDIRVGLEAELGSAGLELARQAFTDWTEVTLGGDGDQAAHAGTALEILTVFDDDGNLSNGTPHDQLLCEALERRLIPCPLTGSTIATPMGTPEVVPPGSTTLIPVAIAPSLHTPRLASARLNYSISNGAWLSVPLQPGSSGGSENAVLPASECGAFFDYYLSVRDDAGGETVLPSFAPSRTFRSVVGEFANEVPDDFTSDLGWTVNDSLDPGDATQGTWVRGQPLPTSAQPGTGRPQGDGTCWFTGQAAVDAPESAADVDGGSTSLRSRVLNLTAWDEALVGYWRWYSSTTPEVDSFLVEISDQGGAPGSWVVLEDLDSTLEANDGWRWREFRVGQYVSLTNQVVLRFVVGDLGSESLVEAAIDDFRLTLIECGSFLPPQFRRADCNADGIQDMADVTRLLDFLFSDTTPVAPTCREACDTNDDGTIDVGDPISLIGYLFAGSAPLPPPITQCGFDPTPDSLDCGGQVNCP